MPNSHRGMLLLSHTHADWKPRIPRSDMLAALPEGTMVFPPERSLEVVAGEESSDRQNIDWEGLQYKQAEAWKTLRRTVERDFANLTLAYFGFTYIPLALDLGFRVRNTLPTQVFQHHHDRRDWSWVPRSSETPVPGIDVNGLPDQPDHRLGDVVVRIAVSYPIDPTDTRNLPGLRPIGEIDIFLSPIGELDAFCSPEELETFVVYYRGAMQKIVRLFPNARAIHLFAACPVGLAFRMGQEINPTIYPKVVSWKYIRGATPRYQRALVLGADGRRAPTLKKKLTLPQPIRILFMASEPMRPTDPSNRMQFGQELREIKEKLESSRYRDRFLLEGPHMAVQARKFQTYLDRSEAQIVHFSGHGNEEGEQRVEGESPVGMAAVPRDLPMKAVVRAFKITNSEGQFRCVVLNSCFSGRLAAALTADSVVPCAIGMSETIEDRAAVLFAEEFYRAIADKEERPIKEAFDLGCNHIALAGSHNKQDHIPKIHFAPGIDQKRFSLLSNE